MLSVTKQLAQKAMQTAAPALSAVASSAASELIHLKVDGHPVKVAPGATMLVLRHRPMVQEYRSHRCVQIRIRRM